MWIMNGNAKQKLEWKNNGLCKKRENTSKWKALMAFSVLLQCFSSAQLSRQFGTTYIYLFCFLTGWRSCYATNRFLYILITSTSWCERGQLQICSPIGLISFYPAVAQPCTFIKMQLGVSVECWTLAHASINAITATTAISLLSLLLHLLLLP